MILLCKLRQTRKTFDTDALNMRKDSQRIGVVALTLGISLILYLTVSLFFDHLKLSHKVDFVIFCLSLTIDKIPVTLLLVFHCQAIYAKEHNKDDQD